MIVGIGVDIVEIDRITVVFTKYNKYFKARILSAEEITAISRFSIVRQIRFIAKRFAAKEALSKAFGVGIGQKLQFKNITILNDELGKPCVTIHNQYNTDFTAKFKIDLSMSDDANSAIAFAVVSGGDNNLNINI